MSDDDGSGSLPMVAITIVFAVILAATILCGILWWMTGWCCCFCRYEKGRRRRKHRGRPSRRLQQSVYATQESGKAPPVGLPSVQKIPVHGLDHVFNPNYNTQGFHYETETNTSKTSNLK